MRTATNQHRHTPIRRPPRLVELRNPRAKVPQVTVQNRPPHPRRKPRNVAHHAVVTARKHHSRTRTTRRFLQKNQNQRKKHPHLVRRHGLLHLRRHSGKKSTLQVRHAHRPRTTATHRHVTNRCLKALNAFAAKATQIFTKFAPHPDHRHLDTLPTRLHTKRRHHVQDVTNIRTRRNHPHTHAIPVQIRSSIHVVRVVPHSNNAHLRTNRLKVVTNHTRTVHFDRRRRSKVHRRALKLPTRHLPVRLPHVAVVLPIRHHKQLLTTRRPRHNVIRTLNQRSATTRLRNTQSHRSHQNHSNNSTHSLTQTSRRARHINHHHNRIRILQKRLIRVKYMNLVVESHNQRNLRHTTTSTRTRHRLELLNS